MYVGVSGLLEQAYKTWFGATCDYDITLKNKFLLQSISIQIAHAVWTLGLGHNDCQIIADNTLCQKQTHSLKT